jgi:hypothetical protein
MRDRWSRGIDEKIAGLDLKAEFEASGSRYSPTYWQQILSRPDVLGQTFDDRDDILALESEPPRLSQEVLSLGPDDAAFGLARNRDATSSTKLKHAFVS